MKNKLLRFIAAIPGVPMLINGIQFLIVPNQVSNSLGMELLDGLGRSTQIGDMGAFFLGTAILIFLGAIRSQGRWLYAGAMFIGGAAVVRTIAVIHDAEFATQFIIIELILTTWLCLCAYLIDRSNE